MIGGKYWSAFIASILSMFIISFFLSPFIANYYITYLLTDIVMAFCFAFFFLPQDRLHFYRYPIFHQLFATDLVFFIGFTFLMCLTGLM